MERVLKLFVIIKLNIFINFNLFNKNLIAMHNYCIGLEFINGPRKGEREFITKMNLNPSDNSMPFTMTRKQFPIRSAYAITINKSQGQTLNKVGVSNIMPIHDCIVTAIIIQSR